MKDAQKHVAHSLNSDGHAAVDADMVVRSTGS